MGDLKKAVVLDAYGGNHYQGLTANRTHAYSVFLTVEPEEEKMEYAWSTQKGGKNVKKQHYPWWGYVKSVVRKYPEIRDKKDLKGVEERERDAVLNAIDVAWESDQGSTQMKAIGMIHFYRTHTLTGAAQEIGCDRATAARWQRKFFEDVARNMGLLD